MANEHEPVFTLKSREDTIPRNPAEETFIPEELSPEEEHEQRVQLDLAIEKENLSKWYFWKLEYEMLTHIFKTKNDGTPINISHLANDVIKTELMLKRDGYQTEADHIYTKDMPRAAANESRLAQSVDDYTKRDIPNLQVRGEVNVAMADYISDIVDSEDPDRLYDLTDEILQEVKPRVLEQALQIYAEQNDEIAKELARMKVVDAEHLQQLKEAQEHLKAVRADLEAARSELEARDMALWEASMHDKVHETHSSEHAI